MVTAESLWVVTWLGSPSIGRQLHCSVAKCEYKAKSRNALWKASTVNSAPGVVCKILSYVPEILTVVTKAKTCSLLTSRHLCVLFQIVHTGPSANVICNFMRPDVQRLNPTNTSSLNATSGQLWNFDWQSTFKATTRLVPSPAPFKDVNSEWKQNHIGNSMQTKTEMDFYSLSHS